MPELLSRIVARGPFSMLTAFLPRSRLRAALCRMAALAAMWLAPAIGARADDPFVSCGNIDIGYVDSGVEMQCQMGKATTGWGQAWRQTLVVTGRGYVLLFVHLKATPNSYIDIEDATSVALRIGRKLLRSTPAVSPHDAVSGFDIATFSGSPADDPQVQARCFAFIGYADEYPAGASNPTGYKSAFLGAYCAGEADANSDDNIALVLGNLRLPPQ